MTTLEEITCPKCQAAVREMLRLEVLQVVPDAFLDVHSREHGKANRFWFDLDPVLRRFFLRCLRGRVSGESAQKGGHRAREGVLGA